MQRYPRRHRHRPHLQYPQRDLPVIYAISYPAGQMITYIDNLGD